MSKRANLTNYRTSTTQTVGGTLNVTGTLDATTFKIDGVEVTTTAAVLNALGSGEVVFSRAALAAAGADATDATAIATQVVAVTASNGAKGVALPAAATTAAPILVINTVATTGNYLNVYPVNGGNDNINGLAEDLPYVLGPGQAAWFVATSATQWYVAAAGGALSTAAELSILVGVTATAAEINNACDDSLHTQAITGAAAVTVDGTINRATLAGGAYAITLAAPGAAMRGKMLTIEYIGGDTDAVTLALTNVQGGTASTTATFNADNETLILVGGLAKWNVIAEIGVTLS